MAEGDGKESDQRSGWVTFGFYATGIYIALFAVVFWSPWTSLGWNSWVKPKALDLNELGDLLAGAFAPLAFLWLLVAVMVQSQELKAQREELALTRRELADTRGVIAQQAAAAKANADFVGQQTEILRRQSEREEGRNASEQFESLVRTTATLLRTRIAGDLQLYQNGRPVVTLLPRQGFVGDDQMDLIAASRQIRKVISGRRELIQSGEVTLATPYSGRKLAQLIQALDSMSVLFASSPHIGPFLTALELDELREELLWLSQLPYTA